MLSARCDSGWVWGPKRGSLKAAGKRQESAAFLQRSFFNVERQFFVCCSAVFGKSDVRTAESECCTATSAARLSEICSATSVLACGMLQGWGLGLADPPLSAMSKAMVHLEQQLLRSWDRPGLYRTPRGKMPFEKPRFFQGKLS